MDSFVTYPQGFRLTVSPCNERKPHPYTWHSLAIEFHYSGSQAVTEYGMVPGEKPNISGSVSGDMGYG